MSNIVWSDSFRRAVSKVPKKGEKEMVPSYVAQSPLPSKCCRNTKHGILFSMAVSLMQPKSVSFNRYYSNEDLEGKLTCTRPKASRVDTTVYLKLKCVSDLPILMHNMAPRS